MALLKSLIQRLLDSRTTPEEAGHSAMPDYSVMTTFTSDLSGTGTIYEGVAPQMVIYTYGPDTLKTLVI